MRARPRATPPRRGWKRRRNEAPLGSPGARPGEGVRRPASPAFSFARWPVLPFGRPRGATRDGVDVFIQQIINGLTLGAVYAIVALGYTMVYGIIQLINFAHGEVVMIGAMVAYSVIGVLGPVGMPPLVLVLLAAGCAIPACMAVGYAMERAAYRPLRRA